MIGGIMVSDSLKAQAHSDGDVLIHSLIDALLGAMGEPDIGEMFPDSDPAFKGIASSILLKKVKELLNNNNIEILNLDCVLVIEEPKLSPFKNEIVHNITGILGIPRSDFNLIPRPRYIHQIQQFIHRVIRVPFPRTRIRDFRSTF